VPPLSTRMSAAAPSAGLAVMPEFGGRDRLAPRRVGVGHHGAEPRHPALDGLAGAARVLDRHGLEVRALTQAVFGLHAADLEHLAAKPDQQHAGDVGVGGVAPLRALQRLETRPLVGHAAAGAMHQRDDAVDVGVVPQDAGTLDLLGHEARHRGRAVHGREDCQVVPGAGAAVGTAETLECRLLFGGQHGLGPRTLGELVVAVEVAAHREVMLVHPVAGRDGLRGETDDLAELQHRRTRRDGRGRHLVTLGHAGGGS